MKAEVFTKNNCPYCVNAKSLLTRVGIEFEEIDATLHRDPLIERVTAITGQAPRTVPQIFIDDHYVGGYDDLVKHLNQA